VRESLSFHARADFGATDAAPWSGHVTECEKHLTSEDWRQIADAF